MLCFEGVTKAYRKNGRLVQALQDIRVDVGEGEFVLIKGRSGCGKTTLLLSAGGMLAPSSGRVLLETRDVYALTPAERSRVRAERIGFVFQSLHLIPYLSVGENILLGYQNGERAEDRLDELVDALGLAHRAKHRPSELSAGEKQRVALARAFIGKPPLILADEPTGNLDPDNAHIVMEHLHAYHRDGATVLVVTHGTDADAFATRTLRLCDGKLEPETTTAGSVT